MAAARGGACLGSPPPLCSCRGGAAALAVPAHDAPDLGAAPGRELPSSWAMVGVLRYACAPLLAWYTEHGQLDWLTCEADHAPGLVEGRAPARWLT